MLCGENNPIIEIIRLGQSKNTATRNIHQITCDGIVLVFRDEKV